MDTREKECLMHDLISDEGLMLKPYICSAGKATIGVGRNLDDRGISEEEAGFLLKNDINGVLADLDRNIPWWRDLAQPQRLALVNMAFNLGWPRLRGFKKMLAALKAGDGKTATTEALNSRWADQVGTRATRIAEKFEDLSSGILDSGRFDSGILDSGRFDSGQPDFHKPKPRGPVLKTEKGEIVS